MESVYGKVPVPKPLYQSDANDEHFVGTSFIVMDYVEVSPSICITITQAILLCT